MARVWDLGGLCLQHAVGGRTKRRLSAAEQQEPRWGCQGCEGELNKALLPRGRLRGCKTHAECRSCQQPRHEKGRYRGSPSQGTEPSAADTWGKCCSLGILGGTPGKVDLALRITALHSLHKEGAALSPPAGFKNSLERG